MDLQITGLHMEVGESLKSHCQTALGGIADYFPEIVDANIQFSTKGHLQSVDVKLHASQIHLRAEAEGDDCYKAMDDAVHKLVRRLKKYKGRIQKHRKRRDTEKFAGAERIVAIHNQIEEEQLDSVPETGVYAPNVVKKEMKDLQMLTVDEAVMQMDLMHTSIFLFHNIDSGSLNVVYREDDDTIGWVETDKLERATNA